VSLNPRPFSQASSSRRFQASGGGEARAFSSAGSGGQRGRPVTTIQQGGRSRALVAARRYRNQQENKPQGGALGPQPRSVMARGELNALRAEQRRDDQRRDAVNLAPLARD
jgi:hypothetical protein